MRTEESDVVVVGSGAAGLAAALEAAVSGGAVTLLEKNAHLGGTSALSVGSVSACCTPHQRRQGIQDSPEEFAEDMGLFCGAKVERDNLELRRLVAEKSSETFAWLEALGLVFFGPMPEPPNRYPRMHNIMPNSSAYIYQLSRAARKRGVRILTNARATRLLQEDRRVTGVEADTEGGEAVQFIARRGVVLATGDYSSSRELKTRLISPAVGEIDGINPTSTGDGHSMGLALGAKLINGDLAYGPEIRFVAPPRKLLTESLPPSRMVARVMHFVASHLPERLLRPIVLSFLTTYLAPSPKLFEEGAILVNREGRRFVNEQDAPYLAISRQSERSSYIVFDDTLARQFDQWPHFVSTAPGVAYAFFSDYRRNRRDIFFQGRNWAELAGRMGVPAADLAQAVDDHNRCVAQKQADAFGRTSTRAIDRPPFYALGPAKSWVVMTDGGLAVNSNMEVLDESDKVIPGLYAAGSSGQGGVLLEGHGLHLMWGFASGRIAGRNAAAAP